MKSRATGSVILGVLAAVGAFVLTVSSAVAVEAIYPVEHAKRTFVDRVWSRVRGFFRGSSAEAENVRLRREVAAFALVRADNERLEAENARLRRGLSLVAAAPQSWLPASVLSTDGGAGGARSFVRVDRGALSGVEKGSVVVVPEGLVGRVTAVTPHTAEITLLTDSSECVHCQVEGGSRVRGILSGGSAEQLVLREAAGSFVRLPVVPPQAHVVTSGLGGAFPGGIRVGTWIQFVTNGAGVVTAEIAPSVDFADLKEVFIRRAR